MDKPNFFDKIMNLNTRRYHIERIREVEETEEIIGYLRLSTKEQSLTSALPNQRARLIDKGITLLVIDIETGKVSRRGGFQYMMGRVRDQRVKAVILTRLDRLGRTSPIIRRNVEVFRETGVNLIAIDHDIDLHSPQGMFVVNLLASIAEMEVEQTGSRIRAVKEYRRRKRFACDYAPFGYITEDHQYKLNTTPYLCLLESRPANYLELYDNDVEPFPGLMVWELARDCVDLFLLKKGITPTIQALVDKYGLGFTIAKKYGGNAVFYMSAPGLSKWLINPVLCGHTVYKKRKQLSEGRRISIPPDQWEVIENTHPDERLITDEELAEIKRIRAFNVKRNGYHLFNQGSNQQTAYSEYVYQRGLIYCDQCGQRCSATSRHSKDGQIIYYYYYCKNRLRGCNNGKGTRRDLIERKLIEHLLQQSFDPQGDEPPPANSTPLNSSHKKKLERLTTKLQQLEAIDGFDPEIEKAKTKTQQEIERISRPFQPDLLPHQTVRELIQAGNGLLLWHSLSADEKAAVYPRLIDRITIDAGKVVDVVLKRLDASAALELEDFE
jgi:site-specific DNA recombinase